MNMKENVDPVTLEIVKNALGSIADEMALVILRTAYSPIVRDSMDFSTAVFDRNGRTVAQGLTLAVHLGAFPDAMRKIVSEHGESMRPGDMFLMNDPYSGGGMHLPDIYMILPIFEAERVAAFVGTIVHHADVGGAVPGSMALGATEIFQEGLRIPLVKIYEEGRPNAALFSVLEMNSRMPSQLIGDLRAQVASCKAGERGVRELLAKLGPQAFADYCEALHDYAERLARAEIASMPDGDYFYEDYIDGLGSDPTPIAFKVRVTVAGSDLVIDWTGTDKQVQGAINGPIATTNSVTYAAVRSAMGIPIPNCDGFSRALSIRAELGSIVHPEEPAACAARGVIAYRMFDVLLGAFAQIVPERMPALGEGGPSVVSFSGRERGRGWLVTDGILGSWGGRPGKDGVDGISNPLGNMANQPIELMEARLPIKVLRYELVNDSGGGGRYRGGLAIRRSYEVLSEEAQLGLRSDRRSHLASGLKGGLPGSPSLNILSRKSGEQLLDVMPLGLVTLMRGDRFTHIAPGGGGYGDPLARPARQVLEDILDGKVSKEFAEKIYGVVLKDGRSLDEFETDNLRRRLAKKSHKDRITEQLRIFLKTNSHLSYSHLIESVS
ncbi:MAG TPA: hydantoinase B/oxoprolinase family protein [Steroidobacter sp.]|uniref:hydantoinase B/oxoprolinase family protein n=1 Tax=Steroidobacter sp. TaxID=1978227 RepID=UPI002ED99FA9